MGGRVKEYKGDLRVPPSMEVIYQQERGKKENFRNHIDISL